MDEMLDDIMLYWLPGTAASAARMYWENSKIDFTATAVIDLPVGCSIFPKEIYRAPRSWALLAYSNLIHWNELDRGGHFAAFEQPKALRKRTEDLLPETSMKLALYCVQGFLS
jgi:hypothetical protein